MLIGHLGGNPELRYLPQTDRAVARFSLATNERSFNPSTNESKDYTEWHRIVVWGKQAEFCEKYLAQGRQVLVEGKIRTRNCQDKDGNKRYTTEINAINIVLLGKRDPTDTEEHPESPKTDTELTPKESTMSSEEEEGEDEVPF